MIIAVGGGLCLLCFVTAFLLFGARMAARQKSWLPASTRLMRDSDRDPNAAVPVTHPADTVRA